MVSMCRYENHTVVKECADGATDVGEVCLYSWKYHSVMMVLYIVAFAMRKVIS